MLPNYSRGGGHFGQQRYGDRSTSERRGHGQHQWPGDDQPVSLHRGTGVQYADLDRRDGRERESTNTYIVTVNKTALGGNNNLQSLSVSPVSLAPTFAAGTTNYTVDVATSVTSVTVTARAQDAGASVSINGQPQPSLLVPLNGAGANTTISIVVTAPNGSQKPYIVTVNRAAPGGNNNLQSLSVSQGSLSPTFNPSTRSYTVNVADTVERITVAAQAQDAGATVSIENQTTTSLSVQLEPAGNPTLVSIDRDGTEQ